MLLMVLGVTGGPLFQCSRITFSSKSPLDISWSTLGQCETGPTAAASGELSAILTTISTIPGKTLIEATVTYTELAPK